jgi:hypothetical protein
LQAKFRANYFVLQRITPTKKLSNPFFALVWRRQSLVPLVPETMLTHGKFSHTSPNSRNSPVIEARQFSVLACDPQGLHAPDGRYSNV